MFIYVFTSACMSMHVYLYMCAWNCDLRQEGCAMNFEWWQGHRRVWCGRHRRRSWLCEVVRKRSTQPQTFHFRFAASRAAEPDCQVSKRPPDLAAPGLVYQARRSTLGQITIAPASLRWRSGCRRFMGLSMNLTCGYFLRFIQMRVLVLWLRLEYGAYINL